MIVFGVAYIILLSSIHDYVVEDKKLLAKISIYFGVIFTTLISINYFIQLSAVRLNILKRQIDGLGQFVQSNPTSGIAAINMLGWSVFLGLSSMFIAPIFSGNGLEKIIKLSFLANGFICILGGIGYVFDIVLLVFLSMNLGMGISLLVGTTSLFLWYRRNMKLFQKS